MEMPYNTGMGPITIVFGLVLIAVGCNGYFNTDSANPSVTALIPAFVGAGLVLLGALALRDNLRKHAMHAAAMLGTLGFLAAAGRIIQKLVTAGKLEGSPAIHTGLMALVCGVFVGLCVKSFIDARRRRQAGAAISPPP
jgi:hypothetical protein